MYQINKAENNLTKLEKKSFTDLGFRERENLQEWIAKNPDCLGEDFLIIQKEFAGNRPANPYTTPITLVAHFKILRQ